VFSAAEVPSVVLLNRQMVFRPNATVSTAAGGLKNRCIRRQRFAILPPGDYVLDIEL
jgi:hypothetical protein